MKKLSASRAQVQSTSDERNWTQHEGVISRASQKDHSGICRGLHSTNLVYRTFSDQKQLDHMRDQILFRYNQNFPQSMSSLRLKSSTPQNVNPPNGQRGGSVITNYRQLYYRYLRAMSVRCMRPSGVPRLLSTLWGWLIYPANRIARRIPELFPTERFTSSTDRSHSPCNDIGTMVPFCAHTRRSSCQVKQPNRIALHIARTLMSSRALSNIIYTGQFLGDFLEGIP